MNNLHRFGAAAALTFLLLTASVTHGAAKTAWEYKVVFINLGEMRTADIQTKINALGAEGWELVTATEGDTKIVNLYFKRLK